MSTNKYYCPVCGLMNVPRGNGKCPECLDTTGDPIDLVEVPLRVIGDDLYKEHVDAPVWLIPKSKEEDDLLDCLTGLYYGLEGYSEKSLQLLKDYKCDVILNKSIDNVN